MKYAAFQSRMRNSGKTNGQRHKIDSDAIMNATWNDDIASRTAYMFDFAHDNMPLKFRDIDPRSNPYAVEVDIKFLIAQYSSLSKDQPEYHIIFRPGSGVAVEYYEETIGRYGAEYPVGLMIAIPDDEGKYNKWLICQKEIANQFPKYLILPINNILHWVDKKTGRLCDYPIVIRSRNSYNSGIWSDYLTTSQQNQLQLWMTEDDLTTTLFYNQRFCIDSRANTPGLDSYLTWQIAKVENEIPPGVTKLTLSQEPFDPARDKFDPITGFLYADYTDAEFSKMSKPSSEIENFGYYAEIMCDGPQTITVGGPSKQLSLVVYDNSGNELSHRPIPDDWQSSDIGDYWSAAVRDSDFNIYLPNGFDPTHEFLSYSNIVSPYGINVKISDQYPDLIGKTIEIKGHDNTQLTTAGIVLKIKSL